MKILNHLKSRFPKLYPALPALLVLAGVGGYTAYERLA